MKLRALDDIAYDFGMTVGETIVPFGPSAVYAFLRGFAQLPRIVPAPTIVFLLGDSLMNVTAVTINDNEQVTY
jgi:hypothetical protein